MNKEQETMKLLSFSQVLQMTEISKRHILLGNGFSQAFDKQRFSYTSLKKSAIEAHIINENDKVYQIFERLQTSDFETVMKILDDSSLVISVYDQKSLIPNEIKSDSQKLKGYLAKIITNNHPANSCAISEKQKMSCTNFLKKFKRVFTLNYDLLSYWSYIGSDHKLNDGFGDDKDSDNEPYVIYKNDSNSKLDIYYLHGALHYYDCHDSIIKITYNNSSINLVDQVQSKLQDDIYPIFISEGNSEQKMCKIIHNGYLNHCYRSLKQIGGNLIIFGASLDDHDQHILNAILCSRVNHIFYGVSSINSNRALRLENEVSNINKNSKKHKELSFFDYKTVNPWKDFCNE